MNCITASNNVYQSLPEGTKRIPRKKKKEIKKYLLTISGLYSNCPKCGRGLNFDFFCDVCDINTINENL